MSRVENMTVRVDLAFLRRREAEELAKVEAADDDAARQAHRALADAYAQRIAECSDAAE